MKRKTCVLLGAVALLAHSLAAQPARSSQNSVSGASADVRSSVTETLDSAAVAAQAERPGLFGEVGQVQGDVQAALAKAQAELARAMEEVRRKAAAHQKDIAAKLAVHRGAMLADLQARKAELSVLAQERASRVMEPLLSVEESEGGWLGVQIADVDAQKVKDLKLPAERGVLITEVDSDSPAAKAGLKVNDVVTEFNGQRVESATQFRRMVRESLAGRIAQLTVWRDGRAQSLSATLGGRRDRADSAIRIFGPRDFDFEFSMPEIFTPRAPVLGINAEDISGQLGAYFGAPGGEGILVREVNSGSPAEKAGMKAGDVITRIDGDRIRSLNELREKLRAKREQKTVSVGVIRKGSEVSLNVEIEQPRPPEHRRIARRSAL
ncbi:MAG: PDZ domain-containing protein [Acidobacteria bacterium]|nr:PDZ domain-containing protein [Acidobacteriota bacterium]MBI3664462.1 PDZ domain-containing protein [Acidobacteriota bacterium]